jgi:pimeloyl-[acyl-carrier protein] methyl ester esterase
MQSRLAAAANVDVSAELSAIDVPSLYLQASEDLVVPKEAAEAFSRASARGNVEVVTGPHFLLQCAPSDAAKSIVRFVERLPSGV